MNSTIVDKKKDIPVMMKEVDIDALADRCLQLLDEKQKHKQNQEQVFIGIVGGPGSGKSTIAEQVRDKICNPERGDCLCAVVGMDGYHLSRQQLKDLSEAGHKFKTDQETKDGTALETQMSYEDLMARRGAAFTYDPGTFIRDLKAIKAKGEGSLPVYSREQHDPIPNGVSVHTENKIVLIEGNYLLCFDDPDWKPLEDLFDDTWYIDVSLEETKQRLVQRHLKTWDDNKTERWGGNDEKAAARKAESNDLKNARCIERYCKHNANLIIQNE